MDVAGPRRALGWLLVAAAVASAHLATLAQPAGFRMVVLILALLFAMKAVVSIETFAPGAALPLARWLAFAAWFGMRPRLFATFPSAARPGARDLVALGVRRLVAGAVLLLAARAVWAIPPERLDRPTAITVATLVALPALSLVLHFGIFDLAAAVWRGFGVDAERLFRDPLRSRSLSEFWGRRWNLAFSEMTSTAVFRPLARVAGARAALVAAFVFSGLLHELAISLPVNAGYGMPMAYFALQAALMTIERGLAAAGHPIDAHPLAGRAWTLAWLIVPLPILFHPPFLAGVVWPLLRG